MCSTQTPAVPPSLEGSCRSLLGHPRAQAPTALPLMEPLGSHLSQQAGQNPSAACSISRASREEAANKATYYKTLQPSIRSPLFTLLCISQHCDCAMNSNTALGYFLLSKSTLKNSNTRFVKQSLRKKKYHKNLTENLLLSSQEFREPSGFFFDKR